MPPGTFFSSADTHHSPPLGPASAQKNLQRALFFFNKRVLSPLFAHRAGSLT